MTLSVAGSSAGIARMAGIAGAFKACLDILSDISCLKAMEEGWPLLQARLDVERTLLLQWASKVKLTEEEAYDKCLDDVSVHNKAFQLLRNTQTLLTDKAQLQHRFGVTMYELEDSLPGATYLTSYLILSKSRMEHFNSEFSRREFRVLEAQDGSSLSPTQFLWVVNDPEGCERLIENVGQLVNALNRLASNPNCLECASQMAKEDVRRARTMDDLRMVRDAAKGVRDTIAHSAEDLIVNLAQRRVLKDLWFRGMHERKDTLHDAHPGTFEWALKPPEPMAEWDGLAEWLESGSDIYWVCGKAGAGKSTFLKYVHDHAETRKRLTAWGGRETVSLGSYFFWSMGADLQKTRDGLARVILYHILREIPTIMPLLVPTMWRYAYEGCLFESHELLPLPAVPDVRMAFEKMAEDGVLDRRFCFIIDALDEYAGDRARAVNFIQRLIQSPKIKVVVSSRPHPVFVEAFANTPKLHLHDLTGGDVLKYVQDKAGAHSYMHNIRAVDENMGLMFTEMLAEKACGVFLWTVLGTKALLQGFDKHEDMYQLEQRIEAIPEKLEDLYKHMLSLVDPRHREQAAKILRICYRSKQSRSDQAERGRTWTVGLAAIDEHNLDLDNFEPHQERSLQARHRQCLALEGRIASRCGGLLEVLRGGGDDMTKCFCGKPESHPNHDALVDSSVEFVHRTAFEWFGRHKSGPIPGLEPEPEFEEDSFSPDAALASMSWHQCRLAHDLGAPFHRADMEMANCMMYVQSEDKFSARFADNMLRRIHQLVTEAPVRVGENWYASFCCHVNGVVTESLRLLYFAVAMGMVKLVRYYLEQNPDGPTLRELEVRHSMSWWRVAVDRTLINNFLEPYYETIRRIPSPGPMLLYLARSGCAVPSNDLKFHLGAESLDSYGSLSLI